MKKKPKDKPLVVRIARSTTREELVKLSPKGAKRVLLLVDGGRYPEREHPIKEVENFVGLNATLTFIE